MSAESMEAPVVLGSAVRTASLRWGRVVVYGVLLVAAAFFLAPLYVMLATSLNAAEQIPRGNLLALPRGLNFDAWGLAWSAACTRVDSSARMAASVAS